MKISHAWLQSYFKEELPSPSEIESLLSLHSFEIESVEKVENDTVYDIDVLPNRAHDCLSHEGIARELSLFLPLTFITLNIQEDYKTCKPTLSVEVRDIERCRRYMMQELINVKVAPSPIWLVQRLEAIGQRSINNIVDIANFVMFDTGNPVHVFDREHIQGPSLLIERSTPGTQLTTLDVHIITLDESMLVISDQQKPLVIAGIKGGKDAGVTDATSHIVLEVANFEPVSTRATSLALGIRTESSKRYENDFTPERAPQTLFKLRSLLMEVAGGEETLVSECIDVYPNPSNLRSVEISLSGLAQHIGMKYTYAEVVNIFKKLQWEVKDADTENLESENEDADNVMIITIPHDRLDIVISEDVYEEVARIYGYEKIPSLLPTEVQQEDVHTASSVLESLVRRALTARGFCEIVSYTFLAEGDVYVQNPIADDKGALRNALALKFSEAREKNVYHAPLFGTEVIRQFEIGTVYTEKGEERHLAMSVDPVTKRATKKLGDLSTLLDQEWNSLCTALDIPYQTGVFSQNVYECLLDETTISSDQRALLNFQTHTQESENLSFKQFSVYPFMTRDISLGIPFGTEIKAIESVIRSHGGDSLIRVDCIDEFTRDDIFAVAFRVVFQSQHGSLTDQEISFTMKNIEDACRRNLGWNIR